jgi:TolB protein
MTAYLSRLFRPWLALLLCLPAGWAQAQIEFTVVGGQESASPIAVVPLAVSGAPAPEDVAAIVAADLKRSGRFKPLAPESLISRPSTQSEVNFKDWRVLGADHLVVGKIAETGGQYTVQVELLDVPRATQAFGYSFTVPPAALRRLAHQISDLIYEKITGQKGAFSTRIAYVTTRGKGENQAYELQVADADGHNPQNIVSSNMPIMSPAWAPDGNRLAYVSFEGRQARIFIQELSTGQRRKLPGFPGINGAPAFSPDGQKLALTLSHKGSPDIFVMDLASEQAVQLTSDSAIDTEPVWTPDGVAIVFTSDRSGKPQLYRMPAAGGAAQRLTFEGKYNARASFSADGKSMAFVHQGEGGYHIALSRPDGSGFKVLTDGRLDESPSFAPNGAMVLYATQAGGRGVLTAISSDGKSQHRLSAAEGDVREPAWSPYLSR